MADQVTQSSLIIGEGVFFTGTIHAPGTASINGTVKGEVNVSDLQIGPKGNVATVVILIRLLNAQYALSGTGLNCRSIELVRVELAAAVLARGIAQEQFRAIRSNGNSEQAALGICASNQLLDI